VRLLRLTHSAGADAHRVQIEVEVPGMARRTATARFTFAIPAKEQVLIRWYFEDYREGPADAVTRLRAKRAERRLAELGGELFAAVFEASPATRSLWAAVQPRLAEFRVEVVTDVAGATSLPWEAMTGPGTGQPLALAAGAMVRAQPQAALAPVLPEAGAALKVLVVIARPHVTDVAFRSVARHLVRQQESSSQALQLDVLRPPAFAQLTRVLQAARDRGAPYRVVHFDGHGVWGDPANPGWLAEVISAATGGPADVWLASPARPGAHGYLLFENPELPGNAQLVDGPALANLLTGTGVSLLTLNACRSALAEPASLSADGLGDPHAEVRAFGSLAQEVMDTGMAGVLAMRYNIYVATAARLVAGVYAGLVDGLSFGAAVRAARTSLATSPPASTGAAIQDWLVPVAYEAAPLHLTTRPPGNDHETRPVSPARADTISLPGDALPPPPAAGFYGRDDTLLALDRAFDTQPIVLLHGDAGIGKTATAAEFARWYVRTGGASPPVIYTSLTQHATMAGLATSLAALLAGGPAAAPALSCVAGEQHLRAIGQLMCQTPMLWILDDLQVVSGYRDQSSGWVHQERQELLAFLRAARDTQTRLLLLSRHDEQPWLGDLPARLPLPPLPSADRSLLLQAVTATHHTQITGLGAASPALRAIGGNPRSIINLTEQALRAACTTDTELDTFLAHAASARTPPPPPEDHPGTDASRT
jgi:CHAT domain/AAA ATPase domain